jgi:tetratricopeptide (TPR) repeat protein
LEEKSTKEKFLLDQVENVNSDMGHYHDHSNERKMFSKPENEKYSYCERHRAIGNYLYSEGLIPKAAEQYQIALSYYEYCFPDNDEMQAELDSVRHVCLCNISLCYYRMGLLREAVISASKVITENSNHAKAFFRRAQAYRALDEYR